MSYYNTTHLSGGDLKEAQKAAKTQEEEILEIYKYYAGTKMPDVNPALVQTILKMQGLDWPITSVRRAITNLASDGKLIKTRFGVIGLYGRKEYCWRLRTKAEQQKLFV